MTENTPPQGPRQDQQFPQQGPLPQQGQGFPQGQSFPQGQYPQQGAGPQPGPYPPHGAFPAPEPYPQQNRMPQYPHASQGSALGNSLSGVVRGALGNWRRLAVVLGLVLSFLSMLAPWICGRDHSDSYGINGLGILRLTENSDSWGSRHIATSFPTGGWAVRVWLTVLVMLAFLIMAVVAAVADRLVTRTYEIVLTALAGVLLMLMIWGVVNATNQAPEISSTSQIGVWLFLVFVLLTVAAQVWQLLLTFGSQGGSMPGAPGPGQWPAQGQWSPTPSQQPSGWQPAPSQDGPRQGN